MLLLLKLFANAGWQTRSLIVLGQEEGENLIFRLFRSILKSPTRRRKRNEAAKKIVEGNRKGEEVVKPFLLVLDRKSVV